MTDLEQRKKAKEFAEFWKDKGYEKGQSQIFWTTLLTDVFGISNVSEFIEFEDQVHIDKATGFIDAYIPSTKILIEQKGIDKDLRKAIKQSDGSLLNPFQQALRYAPQMGHDRYPRYVITCNFKSFLVYDMNNPNGEPEEILLKDLGKEYYRLSFIIDSKNEHLKKEEELSFKAGELVGKLYDAFSKQYIDLSNEQSQKDLNELCVRLVFCLYAEDAGLFGRKNVFHDYLSKYDDLMLMRENLIKLFRILDTPIDKRDPYLEEELNQFPYVNGGLFSNENIEIPTFTEEIKETLLAKASDDFDWSEISPTIFGAVFESTLNPETRRAGGMHYTSIENIHKVIDPLFLNELREKLNEAENYKQEKIRNQKLAEFQNYISSLNFLDPACGSGNFLTETYLSLRRLENEALDAMAHGSMMLDIDGLIKVSIQQFYGIEINDFAVKVAKTALWIAEAQMWDETRKIISSMATIEDFLPLETYDNIVEGNALRMDWNEVVPSSECSFIMGNPPFIGLSLRTKEQQNDMALVFDDNNRAGRLDYVTAWYKKASNYINNNTEVAFVSTNSICQGEQVPILWQDLFDKGIYINFAYRTFKWASEAKKQAGVSCIIIGFSKFERKEKCIYEGNSYKIVQNINGYLVNANNTFIELRGSTPKSHPKLIQGSKPWDGGFLILSQEERDELVKKHPKSNSFIKQYVGSNEFINGKIRYCLWLVDVSPSQYRNIPEIMNRLQGVAQIRKETKTEAVQKQAETPMLFSQIRQPKGDYLFIPETSSENRRYIPIGFLNKDIIASNASLVGEGATLYDFGILTSNVHMAWMRTVAGRLESRYRYSPSVYNNFPWPNPSEEQKKKIESTAKLILDVRKKYSDSTLADLYDEFTMPSELRQAHRLNDTAVMQAYGFPVKNTFTESDCIAELMKMYEVLVKNG